MRVSLGCVAALALSLAGVARAAEVAVLETRHGEIRIALLADEAPRHVESFGGLVQQGFYDGTTFHRVIPGWIIQGGSPTSRDADPDNDGEGGPGFRLAPELSDLRHVRGAVAMARDPAVPDSAGSQFFIVLGDAPLLDAIGFTIFGWVIDGIEAADRIAGVPREVAAGDRPLHPVVIRRVRLEGGEEDAPVAPAAPAAPAPAMPRPTATAPAARPAIPPDSALAVSAVRVSESLVNVRSGPGISSRVVARLRAGAEVPVRTRQGRWFEVDLGEGRYGWIREDMVTPADGD